MWDSQELRSGKVRFFWNHLGSQKRPNPFLFQASVTASVKWGPPTLIMPTSLERKAPRRLEKVGQNSKPLLSACASRIERGLSCFHWVCYGSTKPGPSACADGQGQKNSDIGVAVGLSCVLLTAYCLPPSAHCASINTAFNSHRTYCQF